MPSDRGTQHNQQTEGAKNEWQRQLPTACGVRSEGGEGGEGRYKVIQSLVDGANAEGVENTVDFQLARASDHLVKWRFPSIALDGGDAREYLTDASYTIVRFPSSAGPNSAEDSA